MGERTIRGKKCLKGLLRRMLLNKQTKRLRNTVP